MSDIIKELQELAEEQHQALTFQGRQDPVLALGASLAAFKMEVTRIVEDPNLRRGLYKRVDYALDAPTPWKLAARAAECVFLLEATVAQLQQKALEPQEATGAEG